MDIKKLNFAQLEEHCQKIRDKIIDTVSKTGGHLSSTLGAVDLIVGMHYVFDSTNDPFIFDVSHQAYAHKLLTERWDEFATLRQFNGICGFTKPEESKSDYFVAGHSSTSISIAVGAAKAIKLKNENRIPVVMIGDGSMSAGMVYEALNELGDKKLPVVIILNDNEMSIAKPIGAISNYLSQMMAGRFYQKLKKNTEHLLSYMPESATYMAKKFEESLRLITPGLFFEELGIEYIGPMNGHNIKSIIEVLETAKELQKPVIIHAQTLKGKGYKIAEGTHEHWHGVSAFDVKTGQSLSKATHSNATKLFSEALLKLATEDEKIVGVTAAMPSGTGMKTLMEKFPERFWDVAIAEQHAVTSMGALAKEGFKPVIAIYSTFLQRAYDQIIHDICLMNLGVTFAIDRGGIVGEDGETHQGVFDISFLRTIPNMTILAPRCKKSMNDILEFSVNLNSPVAFRYPRGVFKDVPFESQNIRYGTSQLLKEGDSDTLFIGFGNGVGRACEVADILKDKLDVAILDLVFVKPLDEFMIKSLTKRYKKWYIFSDSIKIGGVGSAILEFLAKEKILNIEVVSFEYEDKFITHGQTKLVEKSLNLTSNQLAQRIVSKFVTKNYEK